MRRHSAPCWLRMPPASRPGPRRRTSPAPAPRSRRRSTPSGPTPTTRPPAHASTTSRSAPAPASSRSRPRRSTSAPPTRRSSDDELAKDGLIQFPTVIGGVVPVVNIQGIAPGAAQADRPGAGRHLPRQDHQVERPGDPALNPGVTLPDAAIAVGAPRRRLGHHLPLHQLPVEGERRVEGQGRRGHGGQLADRRRRQGQRRRGGLRAAPAELDRLRRVRLRQAEQDDATRCCRTRPATSSRPTTTPSRPPPPAPTGPRPSTRS